jgi:spermidine/putrescine transport system permease protein
MYVGNLIQSQFAVARDIPFGSALSFLLSAAVLLLLYLFRRPLRASQDT